MSTPADELNLLKAAAPDVPDQAMSTPGPPTQVASLARRSVAYLIDGLIMAVLFFVIGFVLAIVAAIANGGHFHAHVSVEQDSTTAQLITAAVVFGLLTLVPQLYVYATTRRSGLHRGQTIGKSGRDLRIVQVDGSEITRAIARDRILVAVVPSAISLVIGPLVDAAFSTPPLFTDIFVVAAAVWVLADFFVAPLIGDDRRTLHDRIAGTVVIGPPSGVPPVLAPTGRPKTAATWIYGTIGTVLIAVLSVANIALLASNATLSSAGGDLGGTQSRTTDSLTASQLSTDLGEQGAMRKALLLGRQFGECLTMVTALADCQSDADLGLPDGTITLRRISEPPSGTASLAGQVALTDGTAWGHPDDRFVGTYDEHGYLWGYIFEPSGDFGPACRNIPGKGCAAKSTNPGGYAFMNDDAAALKTISKAAGG